jgi:multiple sugar transport system substrate-binding protein
MNTIRIAIRNYQDFENALEEEARLFEAAHPGIRVELVSVGIHELHRSALAGGGLREGRFDLALLVTDWLAEGVDSDALEDLAQWQKESPIPDWPDGWPSSLVRPLIFDGKLSSLPWHDGPECLIYRRDLFDEPSRRIAFHNQYGRDLAPPTTWQEFEETARFLTEQAEGLFGTVFAAFPDGHNTLYDFALQLWSRGGEFAADRRPQINTSHAVQAVDFYRRIIREPAICHPRSPQLDSTESGDLFLAGEVAMMVNWFGFAARSEREGSPLAGKVAIASIPSDPGCDAVSLSVFWAMVMGSGSRNKALAWDFLRFLAAPESDLGMTRHGTVGVRLSTWRDPALQTRIPAYCKIEGISLGARQLPAGPQMAAFASVIDSVLTRAITTGEATTDILDAAQREIESKGIRFA